MEHDCRREACEIDRTAGRQVQEREETELTVALVKYSSDDHFVVNFTGLHNAHLLRRVFPALLFSGGEPGRSDGSVRDRRQLHGELALKLRHVNDAKRAKASEKRAITNRHKRAQKTTKVHADEVPPSDIHVPSTSIIPTSSAQPSTPTATPSQYPSQSTEIDRSQYVPASALMPQSAGPSHIPSISGQPPAATQTAVGYWPEHLYPHPSHYFPPQAQPFWQPSSPAQQSSPNSQMHTYMAHMPPASFPSDNALVYPHI